MSLVPKVEALAADLPLLPEGEDYLDPLAGQDPGSLGVGPPVSPLLVGEVREKTRYGCV